MVILCDSREQAVLELSHPYVSEVRRECLSVGDYMVEFTDGFRPPLVFERKSHTDLFSTLGVGYKRFKRELIRAQGLNLTVILLVCCSMTKVLNGSKYSCMSGESTIRRIMTLWVKHGIIPVFCSNETEAGKFVLETFISLGKEHIRMTKEPTYVNAKRTSRTSRPVEQADVSVCPGPRTDEWVDKRAEAHRELCEIREEYPPKESDYPPGDDFSEQAL